MRESVIERYLVAQVKKAGGVAEKFVSPGKRNVLDRIVSWPFGCLDFVELKAAGKTPTAAQLRDHRRREAMGFEVWVLDSKPGVDQYVAFARKRSALAQELKSFGRNQK